MGNYKNLKSMVIGNKFSKNYFIVSSHLFFFMVLDLLKYFLKTILMGFDLLSLPGS